MLSFIEEQIFCLMHFHCNLQIWCGIVCAGFLEHLDLEILLVAFAGLYTRPVMELFGT
jgi:hypothetical protein